MCFGTYVECYQFPGVFVEPGSGRGIFGVSRRADVLGFWDAWAGRSLHVAVGWLVLFLDGWQDAG